jgi:hypothetical protein
MSSSSNTPFHAEKLRFPLPLVITLGVMLCTVAAAFGAQQVQLAELRERQRAIEVTLGDIAAMRQDLMWLKEYFRHERINHKTP